ncbi:hypothetical protein PhCBS80983_g02706 [Powellomyces hirtus]|uniref:Letm1 RBD domain-containing protein n=1 Tax=Powellomyces hirtus TaxID=109895 RepID=A0A507E6X8_9FUNG|nr:hypothetical protein PhCBS80983_g02706 [Powellomyces hirtus]
MVKQLISGTKEFVKETKEAKELKRRNVVDGYQCTRREYFLDAKVKRLAGIRKELSAAAVQSIESGKAVGGSNMTAASFLADDFVLRLAHTQPQYFHIDNLNGPQLRTFNKYLGIWKVGPALYLKRVLRQHADYIKGDDLLLAKEGLESLTAQELKSAMDARGLPSIDVSESQMKADLSEWIALHTTEDPEVPFGLMMLSGIVRVEKQGTFASRTHSAVESLPPPRDEAVMAA